jgi:hypothetical protein
LTSEYTVDSILIHLFILFILYGFYHDSSTHFEDQ